MTTLLISSGGGGAHKALAAYYSKRLPENRKQLTFNIDFLEQPSEAVEKGLNHKHITILNRIFNWIQSTGRGYWLRHKKLTRLVIYIIEFCLFWRVKHNMLYMLRKHQATEIINAQPINIPAIYSALKQYAKENPDEKIVYKICSTDYFSEAMPYWGGIMLLPETLPKNLSITVTGPYSESADHLQEIAPQYINFDIKKPQNYEVEAEFYNNTSCVKRVAYLNSGIGWENENIVQARKILAVKNIEARKFSKSIDIIENESIVQTLGSQGSIELASQVSIWFKKKAKRNSKLCIFAGRAYKKTVNKLKKTLKTNNTKPSTEGSDNSSVLTTVFNFDNGSSIQVVPFCSLSLINQKMLNADTIVVKPSGQSSQQSVQLALSHVPEPSDILLQQIMIPDLTRKDSIGSNHSNESGYSSGT